MQKTIRSYLLLSEEYAQLLDQLAEEEAKVNETETKIAVMTMLKKGTVPDTLPGPGTANIYW